MVVIDYLYLGENLTPTKLIYLVSEGVSGCVGLQSELQLCNDLLFESDLKSDVGNRSFIVESALHLNQSIAASVIINISSDLIYSFNDILDRAEDTLASHHVADGKQH